LLWTNRFIRTYTIVIAAGLLLAEECFSAWITTLFSESYEQERQKEARPRSKHMNDAPDEDIQDLIRQLQDLQIQQSELLVRLQRAQFRNDTRRTGNSDVATPNTTPSSEQRTGGSFRIGDLVRIKNPTFLQANHGVIEKIGKRISVRTASGNLIVRASKNLQLEVTTSTQWVRVQEALSRPHQTPVPLIALPVDAVEDEEDDPAAEDADEAEADTEKGIETAVKRKLPNKRRRS
jgi:hypothetical protein